MISGAQQGESRARNLADSPAARQPVLKKVTNSVTLPKNTSTFNIVLNRTALNRGTCKMKGALRFKQCVFPSVRRCDLDGLRRDRHEESGEGSSTRKAPRR